MDFPYDKWAGVVLLIYTVSLHELGHAWTATYFGDPTPGKHGRLTWNPLVQLHPIYSFVFPLLSYVTMGWPLGWAFCPIDPSRFKKPLRDNALTSLAGPAVNFAAAAFCICMYWIPFMTPPETRFYSIFFGVGLWNLMLGAFNLMPLPGLDGYDVFRVFLPLKIRRPLDEFRRMGFLPLVLAIFIGSRLFLPIVKYLVYLYYLMLPSLVEFDELLRLWLS